MKRISILLASVCGLIAQAAHADTGVAPIREASVEDTPVDQIVVTARRREERAADVPIALSVLGSSTLDRTNTFDIRQVGQLVPTLKSIYGNPRNTSFTIRNLGGNQPASNDGLENGVGIYVDEVYYARPAQIVFELYDVERLEVLRGPQGTLFGKNTIAGAINVTSKTPSFSPGFSGEATLGNFGYRQFRGAVTGPLVDDVLAFRLSGSDTQRDGYIKNIANGDLRAGVDNSSLRGQLLFTPGTAFRLLLSGDYARSEGNGASAAVLGTIDTLANGAPFPNGALQRAARVGYTIPFDPTGRTVDLDSLSNYKMEQWGVSAKADLDLGNATLTSISAYRWWKWTPHNDNDGLGLPILIKSDAPSTQTQFSQELRVNSKSDGRLSYTAGLYYFHQKIDTFTIIQYGASAADWLLGTAVPASIGDLALNGFATNAPSLLRNDSFAAYGQTTWAIADRLKITGGLRYTYEKKTGSFSQTITGPSLAGQPAAVVSAVNAIRAGFGGNVAFDGRIRGSNVSGQINLSYQPSRDVLAYATYARGFKAGGLNLNSLPLGASVEVAPEKADHFEIGLKSSWLNSGLTVNAALFTTQIRNYQASLFNVETTTSYLANVGKVRSRGGELDVQVRPWREFRVYSALAYADAVSVSYPSGPCPIEFTTIARSCNFDGRPLPNASKWSISGGGEFEKSLGEWQGRDVKFFVAVDTSYRSGFYSGADLSIYGRVPGWTLVNAQTGFSFNDHLDLTFWSRNLFNNHYFQSVGGSAGLNSGLISGTVGEPRTYGVTVRARL